jgi:hypothetical protein
MVCKAPQLGGNETLGPKFAPVCGENRWDYVYTGCFEEAIYGLIDITCKGKNTNSIFEAVFLLRYLIDPRNRQQKALQASCCLIQGLCTP